MDPEKAKTAAKRSKIFTIKQLAAWLDSSVPVARRQLKKWGAITSYNQNARFYALPSVVDFDHNGIWRHDQAAFSSHGNLKKTVVALICAAPAGLKSRELGDAIGLDSRSFLSPFRRCPLLLRERSGRGFVWFAADDDRQREQRQARQLMARPNLSDNDALLVLLEWIKQPSLDARELADSVREHAPTATTDSVAQFFEKHSLQAGKKGGPHSTQLSS